MELLVSIQCFNCIYIGNGVETKKDNIEESQVEILFLWACYNVQLGQGEAKSIA